MELLERRYTFPVGKLMGAVREKLKWADGKLVKEIIEKQVCFEIIIIFFLSLRSKIERFLLAG